MRPLAPSLLLAVALQCALQSALPGGLQAASPRLDQVVPRGGQRGTSLTLTLRGERLHDAEGLLFHGPGLAARDLKVENARTVTVTLEIAPDCPLGEHALRLRTRSGLSELRTVWVGTAPHLAEEEPNDLTRPQPLPAGVAAPGSAGLTVEGVIAREDQDAFAFEGRAGQRLSAEVEGLRLGGPFFDPELVLYDPAGRELARCDDAPLVGQDPLLSCLLPVDGRYVLAVRDATWRGGDTWRYRLHLSGAARPLAAFPPGGRPGEALGLDLLGDAAGVASAQVTLPLEEGEWPLVLPGAAAPLPLRVSDLPGASEREPNDRRRATLVEVPAALHGVLAAPGDQDWFRFRGRKGQRLRVRAFARGLGAPHDPVVDLFRAGGKHLAGNDDAQGRKDSDFAATLPEDGEYELRVRDFLERGGPTHVYRVEVAPPAPALGLDLQTYGRNSQVRNSLSVPRGGRMALLVRVLREGTGGAVAVALPDLPAGVASVHTALCADGAPTVPLVVEAPLEAPLGGHTTRLLGQVEGRPVAGGLLQRVPLTTGQPNDAVYWAFEARNLAVAVCEPAPFRLELIEPAAPLARGGALEVEVLVRRAEGFKGPVFVSLLQDAPGTSSRKYVKVEGPADRARIAVTANGNAALGRWPLVAVAKADVQGELWVSSQLGALEVVAPLVRLELVRAAGARGATCALQGELQVDRAFTGRATARLVNLPAHCQAQPVELGPEARAVRFEVTIGAQARLGRHRQVFCELVVPWGQGAVLHRVGHTELRIDPPTPAPAAEPPPPSAAPPPPPTGPAMSRLEQLRAEHAARKAAAEEEAP